MLFLKFSIQFIDDVAIALEENTSRHNKVGLGSSATGVVAGGLGVAAVSLFFHNVPLIFSLDYYTLPHLSSLNWSDTRNIYSVPSFTPPPLPIRPSLFLPPSAHPSY